MPDRAMRFREKIERDELKNPGMSTSMLLEAFGIIEDWKDDSENMATYLAVELFVLFRRGGK